MRIFRFSLQVRAVCAASPSLWFITRIENEAVGSASSNTAVEARKLYKFIAGAVRLNSNKHFS